MKERYREKFEKKFEEMKNENVPLVQKENELTKKEDAKA